MNINHPSDLRGFELSEYNRWLDAVDAETGCTPREMSAVIPVKQNMEVTVHRANFPTVEKPFVVKDFEQNKVFGFENLERAELFLSLRTMRGRNAELFINLMA